MAAATLAGILPSVAQITNASGNASGIVVPPAMSTVALAISAALVATDHFYGYSSAWMRYMVTALDLERLFDEFQLDWETARANWSDGTLTDEQLANALGRIRSFLTEVNRVVRVETSLWVGEFQSALLAIEEASRLRADVVARGGDSAAFTDPATRRLPNH